MALIRKNQSEETSTQACVVKLSWKQRYGHLPWFRRYEFLGALLLALVLAAFFLPPMGAPRDAGSWLYLGIYSLLAILWAADVLSDVEKPQWLKAIAAFGLVILLAWFFYRYSGAAWDKLSYYFFNWEILSSTSSYGSSVPAWTELFQGLWLTIQIAVFAAVFGTLLGLVLAVLRSMNDPVLNFFIIAWVDLFRTLPIIVLMFILYYAFPYLGITLSGMVAGVAALALNSSAFISEIFRSGIESIHHGQLEAARSLGLTSMQTMRLVILPQAMRVVLPPLTSNYVMMLKDTAICSTIAIMEMLKTAMTLQSWLANPTPLVAATLIYLAILLPLTRLSALLETRLKAQRIRANAGMRSRESLSEG
jgi:polar amino acid transport system permease protein